MPRIGLLPISLIIMDGSRISFKRTFLTLLSRKSCQSVSTNQALQGINKCGVSLMMAHILLDLVMTSLLKWTVVALRTGISFGVLRSRLELLTSSGPYPMVNSLLIPRESSDTSQTILDIPDVTFKEKTLSMFFVIASLLEGFGSKLIFDLTTLRF